MGSSKARTERQTCPASDEHRIGRQVLLAAGDKPRRRRLELVLQDQQVVQITVTDEVDRPTRDELQRVVEEEAYETITIHKQGRTILRALRKRVLKAQDLLPNTEPVE